MHYILYKTTNKLNGMIYVGCHETKELEDGYLGSGFRLQRAINKYGRDNFIKKILAEFESSDEMYIAEAELVDENFIKQQDTYNLKEGGCGGWKDTHQLPDYKDRVKRGIARYYQNGGIGGFCGKQHSEDTKQQISATNSGSGNHFYGRKHTKKTKQKMSEAIRNLPKVECPYCGKIGRKSGMVRWHFKNCRKKV